MERKEHVMNYDLDHIRCIQTQLAEQSCGGCRRQGLVLLLRYSDKGRWVFFGYCKACQMKQQPIDLGVSRPLV